MRIAFAASLTSAFRRGYLFLCEPVPGRLHFPFNTVQCRQADSFIFIFRVFISANCLDFNCSQCSAKPSLSLCKFWWNHLVNIHRTNSLFSLDYSRTILKIASQHFKDPVMFFKILFHTASVFSHVKTFLARSALEIPPPMISLNQEKLWIEFLHQMDKEICIERWNRVARLSPKASRK